MKLKFFSYGDPAEEIAAPDTAILGGLAEEDWDKLTPFTGRRQYPAGAEIIRAGGTDRDLYMVISGRVQVVLPRASGLLKADAEAFSEGAVFGVASFLDGRPRAAGAVATCPVELLRLSPDNFEQLSAWHPRIAIVLIRELGALMSGRLRQHCLVL
jgi:CRP/FNR family transcriptional regulator, cyclic AMP receptor protein